MPMTSWNEIVGYTCIDCGKWATHWYGGLPICCACHIGTECADTYMARKAIAVNTAFQKGLPFPHVTSESAFIKDYTLDTEWIERFENDTPTK